MHPPYFALQAQMKKHTTDGLAASTRASSRLHAVSWHWKASHKMCSSVRLFWNACSERYHLPLDCSSSWLVTIETHFRHCLSKRQHMHTYMYAQSTQCAESTEHHALYVRDNLCFPSGSVSPWRSLLYDIAQITIHRKLPIKKNKQKTKYY